MPSASPKARPKSSQVSTASGSPASAISPIRLGEGVSARIAGPRSNAESESSARPGDAFVEALHSAGGKHFIKAAAGDAAMGDFARVARISPLNSSTHDQPTAETGTDG